MVVLVTLALLTCACVAGDVRAAPAPQVNSPAQSDHDWVPKNYRAVVRIVFPEKLDRLPEGTKWVAIVLITDPFQSSEYWLSLTVRYDGAVEASVRVSSSGSVARQMLTQRSGSSTVGDVASRIRVDEYRINSKELPVLADLAKSFEAIRMSPAMPDRLMSDPHLYHFWTRSLYGAEMSADLTGPGPDAKQQGHPLLDWAERVRVATQTYIREKQPAAVGHRPSADSSPQ